jgi:hypothetical protein
MWIPTHLATHHVMRHRPGDVHLPELDALFHRETRLPISVSAPSSQCGIAAFQRYYCRCQSSSPWWSLHRDRAALGIRHW